MNTYCTRFELSFAVVVAVCFGFKKKKSFVVVVVVVVESREKYSSAVLL